MQQALLSIERIGTRVATAFASTFHPPGDLTLHIMNQPASALPAPHAEKANPAVRTNSQLDRSWGGNITVHSVVGFLEEAFVIVGADIKRSH